MYQKWTQLALAIALVLALVLIGFLVIRLSNPPAAPTADLSLVQTQAVAAFAFDLTRTEQAQPQPTRTSTGTAENVPETTQVPAGTAGTAATDTTASVSATPSCYRVKFVRDMTIPDYTIMTPAQVFTKTWRVENNGSCPWKAGFKLVLVGGTAMGGSPFVLGSSVNPGAQMEISIKMAAPTNQTGRVDGSWQMMDTTGTRFGDTLTVVIVIGGNTQAATATP